MKKILALILSAAVIFSLAACSKKPAVDTTDDPKAQSASAEAATAVGDIKLDIDKLTAKDLNVYFGRMGLFKNGNGYETWFDGKESYAGSAIKESVGYCDDEGESDGMIVFVLDTTDPDYKEFRKYVVKNKVLDEEMGGIEVDHLVGNIAFSYKELTTKEDKRKEADAAYAQFVKDVGVTPDF